MLKLLFLFLLLWSCGQVLGQGTAVTKSNDIVVIRGKSYYLHTVQPGQTLYSICKAYGANIDEVKSLNDKKDNALSLYEVLKVPYTDPFVQQDDKFYYHKVVKGETFYSIARLYKIKPKRLLKFNEGYAQNQPLAVGAVVKLPLAEIDLSVLGECCRGDGFFCGCRLIFFCFMMLRLNGLLYGFTDGNVPALRNPPAAFNIAVYIEFMFHDYTK